MPCIMLFYLSSTFYHAEINFKKFNASLFFINNYVIFLIIFIYYLEIKETAIECFYSYRIFLFATRN